jgi:folate-dependent phosphoribosylglycinamide formyltransferase PurN
MEKQPWIALFSQSGSEIVAIAEAIGAWPEFIFTDNKKKDSWHPKLRSRSSVFIEKPDTLPKFVQENVNMLQTWKGTSIVTLHGYLRIMPMLTVEMYNGHPGDIVKYPELKGKDPQRKALDLNLPSTGCVIHKVTEEVDSGEILSYNTYDMQGDEDEDILVDRLRDISVDMWAEFLKGKVIENI